MKIRIDPPIDELRRERVEQATFDRLDAIRAALDAPAGDARRDRVERGVFDQLSAIRGVEKAEAIAPLASRRRWVPYVAFAAAAAIVVVVIASRGGEPVVREPVITQHVVPPGGGPSRWTSTDAIVDAFADTSVEERIDATGVLLSLARGKVECEVEPKPGRLPFQVRAGDVLVTVVGTRFAVQRTPTGVRVDVSRGTVRVTTPTAEHSVTAGQMWSSEPIVTAVVPPAPTQPPTSAIDLDVPDKPIMSPAIDPDQIDLEPVKPDKPAPPMSSKEAFELATKLEPRDIVASARMYRRAADGRDPTYAALALYSLAELDRRRGAGANALRAISEYLTRFPRGTNVEELLWLRVDIHRAAKQTPQMNAAAQDYLRRFPSGTYAKPAHALAGTR